MKKNYLLIIFIPVLAVALSLVTDRLCLGYRCYLPQVIRNSKLGNAYRQDQEYFISSYRFNNIQILLNVKKANIENSEENSLQQKLEQIKSLYQPRFSTYPEVISREIVCEDKYKPLFGQITSGNLAVYYAVGQLTDRLTFGACADDLIKYRGLRVFYRCSSPLADIELTVAAAPNEFSPDFFKRLAGSITCPNFLPGLPDYFSGIRPGYFRQQIPG